MLQCEWPDLHCNGHEPSQGQFPSAMLCCALSFCGAALPCPVHCCVRAVMCCAAQSCGFGLQTNLICAVIALCYAVTWIRKLWLFNLEQTDCMESLEQSLIGCTVSICCTWIKTAPWSERLTSSLLLMGCECKCRKGMSHTHCTRKKGMACLAR